MSHPPPELKAIFFAALDQESPEDLVRYLDDACGADAELRSRVEDLLQAHWAILLLPFVEEGAQYNKIDWSNTVWGTSPFSSPPPYPSPNYGVFSTQYPVYTCPSNPMTTDVVLNLPVWQNAGWTSAMRYYACLEGELPVGQGRPSTTDPTILVRGPILPSPTGWQNIECNRQTTGMFHQVSGVHFAEATDGLSNTAMIVETGATNPGMPATRAAEHGTVRVLVQLPE